MRLFVAGATGAIGKQLVPRLATAGHEVHGMTRSESKQAMLCELGAVPVVADALDPDQIAEAVGRARPDVIVHQLTAIGAIDMRHFDRDFALTNRLRTEATDHLLSAGQAVGVRRFVAQVVAGYGAYARTSGPVKSEEDPLDLTPAREMRETLAAIRHLEQAVLGADRTDGIVLRYGVFYGPGTSLARGAEQFEQVRRRKFPLVGDGGGVWCSTTSIPATAGFPPASGSTGGPRSPFCKAHLTRSICQATFPLSNTLDSGKEGDLMTRRLVSSKVSAVALVVIVIVIAVTVEHAIRTNSFSPIWMIGWLPGVLLAFYRPGAAKRRLDQTLGRSDV